MKRVMIFLAAGLSRRFGGENKLLHELDGLPLYRYTLDKLEQSQDDNTRLLVMTNTPEIRAHCDECGIQWQPSPQAALGIAHTLHAALTHCGEECCVCFVADQPKLSLGTIRTFLTACTTSGKGMGCVSCGDRRGNPVWFFPQYRQELLALTGDEGGRRLLARHPEDVCFLPVAAEELEDIDTPLAICGKFD